MIPGNGPTGAPLWKRKGAECGEWFWKAAIVVNANAAVEVKTEFAGEVEEMQTPGTVSVSAKAAAFPTAPTITATAMAAHTPPRVA